jgi:phosphatidylserine/phosphatidylglycerophosphate/cardiolipin synthase-like enzyme
VVRHPDHRSIDNNVLFWSHHEKIVVVDNRLAFIGGLDLCWGRYDSQVHRLTDYPAEGHPDEIFPGQDYSNPRVKDFLNSKTFDSTN